MEDRRSGSACVQIDISRLVRKFKWKTEKTMRKIIMALATSASTLVMATGFSAPAHAQYCEGTVHGLSSYYNHATGSGFLAVRAGPRGAATQRGELFNGDKVEVFTRRGNWYQIATTNTPLLEGWVSARWLSNECQY
jgi:hypothetical protein